MSSYARFACSDMTNDARFARMTSPLRGFNDATFGRMKSFVIDAAKRQGHARAAGVIVHDAGGRT